MKSIIYVFPLFLACFSCVPECDEYPCPDGYYCEEGFCYEYYDPYFEEEEPIYIETPDPCDAIVCANGGTCVSGTCDCPAGFTGPRCENRVTTGVSGYYSGMQLNISGPDKFFDIAVSDGHPPTACTLIWVMLP